MTCVVDGGRPLVGIMTDGDLRRQLAATQHILERAGPATS